MSTTNSLPESTVCPTCDRDFSTERGMRVHHTTVHDERLPNRRCTDCGTAFCAPNGDRTRYDDCTTQRGKRDPSRGNTTTTCLVYYTIFQYYPSEKSGHYCPDCVTDEDVDCTLHQQSSKQVTVPCSHCGDQVSLFESEANEKSEHFCDRDCYRDWLSSTQRTEGKWRQSDNPNWNGGVDDDSFYGQGWPRARKQTLERDNHTCQRCGDSKDDLGQNPDVHHKRPVRTFDDPRDAHTLDNLICLCRACHLTVEREDVAIKLEEQ